MEQPKLPTAIVPTISVKNGAAAIEFYQKAFGAIVLMSNTDPDGSVVAVMALNEAQFVVADEAPDHGNLGPETLGGTPVRIGLQVSDPDALQQQAVAAGATEVYPVADQSYGYRLGHIADPFGHHWEIFRPIHH
ncbi:MAG: VOC family protein [Mucilaginibacter sp.]